MTLQFQPYKREELGPQYAQQWSQGLQNIGNTFAEGMQARRKAERQAMLDRYLQQEQQMKQATFDREGRKFDSEYGVPISPDISVGMPMGNAARSVFMPAGQGQVATQSPLIEQFNQWRAQGMPKGTARGEYMPALREDERKLFYANANPKQPNGSTTQNLAWDTSSPTQQNMAKAMVEGRILPSDLGMRDRATVVGLANEYAIKNNLPFQSYEGNVKKGMAENLAYGTMGRNALSLNTALGHAGDALKSYDALGNMDVSLLNKPINELKRATNDPKIIALGLNLNALHGELANVFKGGGGTDQEISSWMNYLNEDLTPLQAKEAIVKVDELLRSRLSALEYQQSNVMTQPVTERKLLSPHGAELSKKFQRLSGSTGGSTPQHPKDSEAIQWAKNHLNDPRAQKILQLNGGQ